MGHTVSPMRWKIYDKIEGMKKLVKCLREPEKSIALELIEHVYQNISTITYANPLPKDIEENMIFSMLLQEKRKKDVKSIDDLTLLIFSLIINHSKNSSPKNESDIYRLLRAR